jgi:hypothetical protein
MIVSISLDPRTRSIDVHGRRAISALLATVPEKSWDTFKTKVVRYLLDMCNESSSTMTDEYETVALKETVVEWMPCFGLREQDLRMTLAAMYVISIRHLLPIQAKPLKASSAEMIKIISKFARCDEISVVNRRRDVVEHLSDVRICGETDAREVWCVLSAVHLIDIVLNGGGVLEAEETSPDGGLMIFMRFLSRKVVKSYRTSLSTLRTTLMAVKTRYERDGQVSREALAAAREAIYEVSE